MLKSLIQAYQGFGFPGLYLLYAAFRYLEYLSEIYEKCFHYMDIIDVQNNSKLTKTNKNKQKQTNK